MLNNLLKYYFYGWLLLLHKLQHNIFAFVTVAVALFSLLVIKSYLILSYL